jgi:hypothetical protein
MFHRPYARASLRRPRHGDAVDSEARFARAAQPAASIGSLRSRLRQRACVASRVTRVNGLACGWSRCRRYARGVSALSASLV